MPVSRKLPQTEPSPADGGDVRCAGVWGSVLVYSASVPKSEAGNRTAAASAVCPPGPRPCRYRCRWPGEVPGVPHTQSSSRSFPGAPPAAVGVPGPLWLSWGAGGWVLAAGTAPDPTYKAVQAGAGGSGGFVCAVGAAGPGCCRRLSAPWCREVAAAPAGGSVPISSCPGAAAVGASAAGGPWPWPCRAVPAAPCPRAARSLLPSPSPAASRPLSQRRFPSPRGAGRSPAPAWSCSSRRYKGLRRRHLPLALRRAALPLPLPAQGSGPPGARPPPAPSR